MFRVKLYSKNNAVIIAYNSGGGVIGYTTDTMNVQYQRHFEVSNKTLNWELKQLEQIDKSILNPIM